MFVCPTPVWRRLRFLCNATHVAATAALFSPRAGVKRKDTHALLRAYVKHMIWYKKRTNVLGDVYRKLKRKLWIFITEKKKKHCVDSFISCMYTPHVQGTEGERKKSTLLMRPHLDFLESGFAILTYKYLGVTTLRVNKRSEVNY